MNGEEDVTILIDFKRYQQLNPANLTQPTSDTNNTISEECVGLENSEFKKCGTTCVLSCRYIPTISNVTVTSNDCVENECIEGCFCKDGFVRYQNKCVLPGDCPLRSNKSIEFVTGMPNDSDKRIVRPICGSNFGCMPPPPPNPCVTLLCNNGGNQNFGKKHSTICANSLMCRCNY